MTQDNVFDGGAPINATAIQPVAKTPSNKKSRRKPAPKKEVANALKQLLPKLGIFRMHGDVKMPHQATEESACFDMRAYMKEGDTVTVYDAWNVKRELTVKQYPAELDGGCGIVLDPGMRVLMPTGIIFDIPNGFSVRAHPRSGSSLKNALTLINGEGVIDADYVHEGFLPLVNHALCRQFIKHDERLAQVEMVKNLVYTVEETTTKPVQKTSRAGGFGHTGTA